MTGGDRSALARGIPARSGSARALVGIGQVLEELRQEFPDVSPSKIRFLEAEGLIAPERASSGYRRFAVADIERLRVIKERLDALSGDGGAGAAASAAALTRSELLEATGADEALLAELEDYGLVRHARAYGTEALTVVRCAVAVREYGIQPRHLRAVKAAADREISLVEQVVAPLARQKGSREPALRAARDVAAHIARLHATLVEDGLTDAGLASGPPAAGSAG